MIRAPEAGGAGAPYAVVLGRRRAGEDRALKDEDGTVLLVRVRGRRMLGDPFNPAFLADLDALVEREVAPRRDDPRLQMWFAGNEIGDLRCRRARPAAGSATSGAGCGPTSRSGSSVDRPLCARHALAAFLRERYAGSIGALNAAWEQPRTRTSRRSSRRRPRPVPYVHDCNARSRADLQRFVHDRLLPEWVRAVTLRIRAADPNHLIASPRLAIATPPRLPLLERPRAAAIPTTGPNRPRRPIGDGTADGPLQPVRPASAATARPASTRGAQRLHRRADVPRAVVHRRAEQDPARSPGLPLLISEFGLRARIDGWSNRGGAAAFVPHADAIDDQLQRGQRYRSQIDQFIGFPPRRRRRRGTPGATASCRPIPASRSTSDSSNAPTPRAACAPASAGRPPTSLIADTNQTILQRIAAKTGL